MQIVLEWLTGALLLGFAIFAYQYWHWDGLIAILIGLVGITALGSACSRKQKKQK